MSNVESEPEDSTAELSNQDEPQWTGDELEAAYLRALDALEAVESEVVAAAEEVAPGRFEEAADSQSIEGPAPQKQAASTTVPDDDGPRVTAEQIVEACLFVGGGAMTAAKLANVLRGDYTPEFVEQAIDRLNMQYESEARPYEIRLAEGGYRMVVKEEYERIRHKVFGLGPKEVRLSQDALAVLALVAYHQPVTTANLDELGQPNAGGTLQLLLRRDLIAVDRNPENSREIRYVTTDRFLSLFGIQSLDELPRPDDLMFK